MKMGFHNGNLPPGYKFMPTDKQLIQEYLVPRVQNTLKDVSWFIFQKNIYEYANPLILFQEIQRNQGYFFSPVMKVTSKGKNVKRKTGEGKWNGQKPAPLLDDDKNLIGTKRMFVFEWNVPKEKKSEVEREKGHWIMHEYSLLPEYYTNNNIKKTDPEYVLCEIRCKIPIINVDAVREEQLQSQPVAKRQRTSMSSTSTDTLMPAVEPTINNGSSRSWVPSPLPEAAPLVNDVESSSDCVPSSQPQARKTIDPYVPVPAPESPTILLRSMPDVLNIFSSWDPSLLPAETTTSMSAEVPPLVINVEELPPQAETNISHFMGSDSASIFCNSKSSEWVSSPAATKTMDTYLPLPECEFFSDQFSVNGESSSAWFPSAPLFSNPELSEWVPSQPPATNPYVPVPVPAPTTMLSAASMSEFEPPTAAGDEWVDFFTFDGNDLVPAIPAVEDNLNITTPNNNFSQSVEELDAAIKEDSSLGVQDAVLPTYQSKDYLSGFSLLLQDEDDFAKLLEGELEASNDLVPAIPTSEDSTPTTKDGVAVSLEEDLKGSNNNYVQQEENNYREILMNDSRKVLKVSDAEARMISKLGWDPVAYKANVEAMDWSTLY